MQTSTTRARIGIAAIFIAIGGVMVAIAYGAGGLSTESVIVGEGEVVIEVHDQRVYGAFGVSRVVTPVDGWVIVRADWGDGPAELIGAVAVSAGETRNVAVVADASRDLPPAAWVSVVADRGTIDEFEYITGYPDDTFSLEAGGGGMMGGGDDDAPVMTESMDWLLASGREAVSERFEITPFKISYRVPDANFLAAHADVPRTSVEVLGIDVPEESWAVIILVGTDDVEQNQIIGAAQVPAGHTDRLVVETSETPVTADVSALLVADLGTTGVLEVDPVDPPRSVDSPYIVRSWFVWKRVTPAR